MRGSQLGRGDCRRGYTDFIEYQVFGGFSGNLLRVVTLHTIRRTEWLFPLVKMRSSLGCEVSEKLPT